MLNLRFRRKINDNQFNVCCEEVFRFEMGTDI